MSKADVTFTGSDGTRLRIGEYGISFRHRVGEAGVSPHWTLIDHDQVSWLRDGPRASRRPKWTLEIVLTNGTVMQAAAVSSKEESADPEVLEAVRRAARDHGYTAALTGKLTARMGSGRFPGAGLFPSPGAEPGLREWDGTEWSPLLHTDAAEGDAGGALAARWSTLSRQEQQRHWEDAATRLRRQQARRTANRVVALVFGAGLIVGCTFTAVLIISPATPIGGLIALCVADAVLALCAAMSVRGARRAPRHVRRHAQTAEAARATALRVSGHDVASPEEATWVLSGRRGAELRLDKHEITVREGGKTRWIEWGQVRWFRDGRHGQRWALAIVLKDGTVVTPAAARQRRRRPPAEAVAKVSQAARQHGIPAVLTGTPARDWIRPKPAEFGSWRRNTGLYADPGGELGLREWTGTTWLSDLHVDPATSGAEDKEGPATISSPLPGELQRQLRDDAAAAVPRRRQVALQTLGAAVGFALFPGWLYWPLVIAVLSHWPGHAVVGYALIFVLTCMGAGLVTLPAQNARAIARAARAAETASAATSRPAESTGSD